MQSPSTPPSGMASKQAPSPNGTPWSRTPTRDPQNVKNMWPTSEPNYSADNTYYPSTANGFSGQSGLWSHSLGYQYKADQKYGYSPYGFRAPNNVSYAARPNRFSAEYSGFDGYYGGVGSFPQNVETGSAHQSQPQNRTQALQSPPSRPYPIKKMW